MNKRYLSFLPIPALILSITVLHLAVNPSVFYDPAWLIPITNTLFVAVICFAVACIAMRNYRTTGRIQILMLGCGVLIFGIGGVIAGFVRGLPDGANLNVTIYNTGALVGALFHFFAALILISGISPEAGSKQKGAWLAIGYGGVMIFMALLSMASFRGMIPPFFIQGAGPTPLRQGILGSADALFAFSFLVFLATYYRNREPFLYWYSLALALTSISLTAFFIQHSVGSPVGWAGRFSQYLGGVYFLIALITAIRSAEARRTSFDNIITASLTPGEERFRALAENSPDIIDRLDRELRHVYVNPAGLRLHGKTVDSVVGKTIAETGLPESYCTLWEERIRKVFDTGEALDVEDYFPASSGARFYQSRCVPEFGADGAVANVLVISRDLTEHKAAEEALRRSEANLQIALDAAKLGSWHWDIVTGDISWSAQCLAHYGLPAGTAMTYDLFLRCIHPDDRASVVAALENAVEKHSDYFAEKRVLWPDGSLHWTSSHGRCYCDESGRPARISGVTMDITERKRGEEALKKLNEELENQVAQRTAELREKDQILLLQSRQAAMGEMIGNIAHQWRQPLNALGLTVQQLSLYYDIGEFTREFLDKSVSQSVELIRHMSKTIDDFRNYFRPDKEKAEFKVNEAITKTLSLIEDSFNNRNIRIEVVAKDDPVIFGYLNEFAQALLNILNNASDAITEREINEPRVTITICSKDGCAVVTISDNAGGIPEEIMDKIFDPYFTTKGPQHGTGVGLFMSKAIIEKNMGGRLTARNIADGAEFRIKV